MNITQDNRELAIWLAGIISTDGNVFYQGPNSLRYTICTVEDDWKDQIMSMLHSHGLETSVYYRKPNKYSGKAWMINLRNPRKITELLRIAPEFMMRRKLKTVMGSYNSKYYSRWEDEEIDYIKQNIGIRRNIDIADTLGRPRDSFNHKVMELRRSGVL